MDEFVRHLLQLDPLWIYVSSGLVAFIENVFPPFPSDAIIVAVGSMAGAGRIDMLPALLSSTTGSTIGFVTMYKVGDWFGQRIVEQGKIRFLPIEQIHKVEAWFLKYGYWVVVGNRFLSGTRAVVSFFTGLSELSLGACIVLSFVSALLWNGILLMAGKTLGQNWSAVTLFLEAYGKAATTVVILVALAFVGRFVYRRQSKPGNGTSPPPDKQ